MNLATRLAIACAAAWVPALPLLRAKADDPPQPRQGLTALQTKEAVRIAGGTLNDLHEKTEGFDKPNADTREYVVGVERLNEKNTAPKADPKADPKAEPDAKSESPAKAVVTTYRYFDDTTIYTTVDLSSGKAIEVETAQHMRTPLSDGEYEAAKRLAREKSDEVKALYEKFGKRIEVYAQFSQYVPDGETRVHRVVLILYRIDKRDLSAPRPMVDLTTREVVVSTPEADAADEAKARPPKS